MHFAIFTSIALSVFAAAPASPPIAVDPKPINFQSCTVRNNNGLVGRSFLGATFKPADDQVLLKGTIKDVTFALKSKYTPNTPAGKFAPNNFVLELQKGNSVDTLEAYTDPKNPVKVLLSSKTIDANGVGGSSVAFSNAPGAYKQNMLGLDVTWSVEKTSNGQVTKFSVNNLVDATLNELATSFEPQIVIKRKDTVTLADGVCRQ